MVVHNCYGTTFQGGIKAQLIRPSIWNFEEKHQKQDVKAVIEPQSAQVQSTSDFRMQTHDYVFRGDGSRFQVQSMEGDHLVTGFGVSSHSLNIINYSYQMIRENASSPAYLIPPDPNTLISLLGGYYARTVSDFTSLEFVHGPLVI